MFHTFKSAITVLLAVTHAHDLQDHECATSLISCSLSGDPNSSFSSGTANTYYCVGTAYVFPEDAEPKAGRLLLFQLLEGKRNSKRNAFVLLCVIVEKLHRDRDKDL